VLFVIAMIAVSWCTYNLIEVPWRRRLNRIASGISPKRDLVPLGLSQGSFQADPVRRGSFTAG
jgi:peptidoglycan/LPS O-acetylase OafA/YrhL